jgi:signal transduction histidine kinase
VCLAITVVIEATEPAWAIIEFDDLREGQLEAVAAVVMTLVAGVLLGRVRRDRSRRNLLLATALAVLAVTNLFASIATPLVDSLSTSTFATWTVAGGGALGALLLVIATVAPERSIPPGRSAAALSLAAGGTGLLAIALVSAMLGDRLPAAFESSPTAADALRRGSEHPAIVTVALITAAAYAAAAVGLAVLADRDRDDLWHSMAGGVALAAVASLNYALVPSQYTEFLYAGDLFLLVAVVVLLFGAIVEMTRSAAALVRGAVSSERTRVADELRAGVAQELAFMASQTELFARRPTDRYPYEELAASVERALDESRGAIAALVRPVDEPLAVAVGDAARDAAAGVGARVELDLDPDADGDRECRNALVRLTREAVIVAARHHGARTVSVQLLGGRRVTLRVVDDGRRADPTGPRSAATLALHALSERAEALGASFMTTSTAGTGTTVEVVVDRSCNAP